MVPLIYAFEDEKVISYVFMNAYLCHKYLLTCIGNDIYSKTPLMSSVDSWKP